MINNAQVDSIKLDLDIEEFDELHQLADKGRKRTCVVDKKLLRALLLDHTVLYNVVKDCTGIRMEEPYEVIARERIRLIRHSKRRKRIPKKRGRVRID